VSRNWNWIKAAHIIRKGNNMSVLGVGAFSTPNLTLNLRSLINIEYQKENKPSQQQPTISWRAKSG
jgi:hypothetical protein